MPQRLSRYRGPRKGLSVSPGAVETKSPLKAEVRGDDLPETQCLSAPEACLAGHSNRGQSASFQGYRNVPGWPDEVGLMTDCPTRVLQ